TCRQPEREATATNPLPRRPHLCPRPRRARAASRARGQPPRGHRRQPRPRGGAPPSRPRGATLPRPRRWPPPHPPGQPPAGRAPGAKRSRWWPDLAGQETWPEGVPCEATRDAFVAASATLGYAVCTGEELEPGFAKVALFGDARGVPTHAARQLDSGRWTSK